MIFSKNSNFAQILTAVLLATAKARTVTKLFVDTEYEVQHVRVYVDGKGAPYKTITDTVRSTRIIPYIPKATSISAGNGQIDTPIDEEKLKASVDTHPIVSPKVTTSLVQLAQPVPPAMVNPGPGKYVAPSLSSISSPSIAAPPRSTSQTPVLPPQTSAATAPNASPSNPSSFFDGSLTFYDPGLGACGWINSPGDFIAALNVEQFNSFGYQSNGNPVCGRKAQIEYQGKKIEITITDKCPGCAYGDLDLSPAAFNALADPSEGRVKASWQFI